MRHTINPENVLSDPDVTALCSMSIVTEGDVKELIGARRFDKFGAAIAKCVSTEELD